MTEDRKLDVVYRTFPVLPSSCRAFGRSLRTSRARPDVLSSVSNQCCVSACSLSASVNLLTKCGNVATLLPSLGYIGANSISPAPSSVLRPPSALAFAPRANKTRGAKHLRLSPAVHRDVVPTQVQLPGTEGSISLDPTFRISLTTVSKGGL